MEKLNLIFLPSSSIHTEWTFFNIDLPDYQPKESISIKRGIIAVQFQVREILSR